MFKSDYNKRDARACLALRAHFSQLSARSNHSLLVLALLEHESWRIKLVDVRVEELSRKIFRKILSEGCWKRWRVVDGVSPKDNGSSD